MPKSSSKDDRAAAPQQDSGRREPIPVSRYALFVCLAIVGLAIDLATKSWIFNRQWPHWGQSPKPPRTPGFHLELEISLNEGALFGMGQGLVWFFVVLSILAAIGVIYWLFVLGEARSLWMCVALAMVTAGISGNLYDRLGLHGLTWPVADPDHVAGERVHAVRDWILVRYGKHRWPNFNVADSLLVSGAIMIAVAAVRKKTPEESKQKCSQATA